MAEQQNNPAPPALSAPGIAHDSEYVLGLPVHLAVTVRCDDPRATLKRLPGFDVFGTNGVIGLTLTPLGGTGPAVALAPATSMDAELGAPPYRLGPSESRRMLLDLSPMIPDTLPPGEYSLTLSYGYHRKEAESSPVTLRFRRPGPAEAVDLSRWNAEMKAAGSWGEWMTLPLRDPDGFKASIPGSGPLRFAACIRYARSVPSDTAGAIQALASVQGTARPEAKALAAEALLAAGDGTGFESAAAKLGGSQPDLVWMLEAARQGHGFLSGNK